MTCKQNSTVALVVLSGLIIAGCDTQPSAITSGLKQPVQVVRLSDAQQAQAHQFTGTLQSSATAEIAFRVPGLVHQLLVQSGDTVSKGQIIARLDPHDFHVSIRELEARLIAAKAQHKLAGIELERVKQAVEDDAISSISLDRAQSGFDRSKAQVDVVSQNLQRANDALAYSELKAPFDGVIAKHHVEAFEQVVPGLPVFTLHQPNLLDVEIDVPENVIGQFNTDAKATVSWYQAEQTLPAQLTEIESVPDPIKQTYTVTYRIDTHATQNVHVLPGKSVTLTATFKTNGHTYCVPYSSVLGEDNAHFVFKVNQQAPKSVDAVSVSIDRLKESSVCIKGPLNTDDLIVVAGGRYLASGDQIGEIRVRNKEG